MAKEVYIIRHGRTEYNRLGIWQGSGVDASLDKVGQQQADAFYNCYKDRGFEYIIHSGLKRSKETVHRFIADGIGSGEKHEINEISWGIYEGKPHTEESFAEYKKATTAWSNGDYDKSLSGGETANELYLRLNIFREYLCSLPYDRILVCSHGRAIRGMLCVLKKEPMNKMEQYEHANTGLFKASLENDVFNFEMYNNTDHLSLDL